MTSANEENFATSNPAAIDAQPTYVERKKYSGREALLDAEAAVEDYLTSDLTDEQEIPTDINTNVEANGSINAASENS